MSLQGDRKKPEQRVMGIRFLRCHTRKNEAWAGRALIGRAYVRLAWNAQGEWVATCAGCEGRSGLGGRTKTPNEALERLSVALQEQAATTAEVVTAIEGVRLG